MSNSQLEKFICLERGGNCAALVVDKKPEDFLLNSPSPPPSPRKTSLLRCQCIGGERELFTAGDGILRNSISLPHAIPSPRRKIGSKRYKSYGERARVRGEHIREMLDPHPNPLPDRLVRLRTSWSAGRGSFLLQVFGFGQHYAAN